ncbi:aminopeptidase N [Rheinheimera fenheensis]|uniref:aminopeptidase N n=1 Tax=Rheinheimera fenheensis TaxID=3152295 RepID=UPI00325C4599
MSQSNQRRVAKSRHDYQSPAFSIDSVDLTFELDPKATRVTAIMQVKRLRDNEPLRLDGQQLKLVSVAVDEIPLGNTQYQLDDESLTLAVLPDECRLTIVTLIAPEQNTALEGLYLAGTTYCTQCEAEGFRRISYFLDRPDVLTQYSVTIIADAEQYPHLLSNGNKIAEHIDPQGRRVVRWHDPFPKPCYLFALVAGDFDMLQDQFCTQSGRNVSLQLYVDKGQGDRGHFALAALKRAMAWDEQRFNLEYDLDVYMVVAVDFFNMGAMENKGLNVFNSKYVLADAATATDRDYFNIESIIGHEYFHNWTGNRVTCRDWFQLSLKEGLTVFRDQEFSADMSSPTLCRIDAIKLIKTAQFAEDASPMAHPIRPEQVLEMNNFYTVTVYDKGAEVIRMLQTLLGKQAFADGLALYLHRHDGQAVTCDDFLQAMQDASGVNLTAFARWYSQSGTPELSVSQQYDADTKRLRLALKQYTPATADQTEKQPLVLPVKVELLIPGEASQQHLLTLTESAAEFIFSDIQAEPVVVWLAQFSAPVKLHVNSSDEALLYIATKAIDGVARWEAMQQYWSRQIAQLITGESLAPLLPDTLFTLLSQLLVAPGNDNALSAELLTLPDFDTLAEQYAEIPVDAIITARKQLSMQLAKRLAPALQHCYQSLGCEPYQYKQDAVGRRRLRAVCLHYLSLLGSEELIRSHYHQADNMTDTISALQAAQQGSPELFAKLLQSFTEKWCHDALATDKAFSLAATDPTEQVFSNVEHMLQHPLFSWQNPNRVRGLFSAFSLRNAEQFHRADGRGYKLLQQTVAKLDAINPQVAARLVTPLLSWRRFDAQRQLLMRQTLQQLAQLPAISNDLYEKVSRSLN